MVALVLNGMPSRRDRWLRALDLGFAPVDSRTPDALLDFAAQVTCLYRYFDLQNRPDGDWQPFFTSDAETARTLVLAADPRPLTRRLAAIGDRVRATRSPEKKLDVLREGYDAVLRVARLLDRLHAGLLPGPPERSARTLLADALGRAITDSLAPHLQTLKSIALGAARGATPLFQEAGLSAVWGLSEVYPDPAVARGAGLSERADAAAAKLDTALLAFSQGLTEVGAAVRALPVAPPGGEQAPQMALYTAFVRLFRHAQDTVNAFSRRYVDFYYRDVLRERPLGPVPDSAYVTFTLAADSGVSSSLIAKGTPLSAGEDPDGQTIVFATDKALRATNASIAAIRTLRVVRGPLFEPTPEVIGPPSDSIAVRAVLASDIDRTAGVAGLASFATFGPTTPGVSPVETTVPATLGFAVASPCLHLTSGERDTTLTILGRDPALRGQLDAIALATGLTDAAVLEAVLAKAFDLQGSTATGWLALRPLGAKAALGDIVSLALSFKLPPTAPAIEPLGPISEDADSKAAAGGQSPDAASGDPDAARDAVNPAPSLPTIKAYLRDEPVLVEGPTRSVLVAPLSLFAGLNVVEIGVRVDVKGFTTATIANTDGPVDTSAPFAMFGGTVNQGSSLYVQSVELFEKRLTSLSVTLDWSGLPPNDDGFRGYYRDYTLGLDGLPPANPPLFNNLTFTVHVGVQNPGAWEVDSGTLYLFRTVDGVTPPNPSGKLASTTPFSGLRVGAHTPPRYYNPATGAVQITLLDPPYAFGEDLYSINVLHSVLEDIPVCPKTSESSSPSRARPPLGDGAPTLHAPRTRSDSPTVPPVAAADTAPPSPDATGDSPSPPPVAPPDPPMCRLLPVDGRLKYPNAPWTPLLAGVTLDYTASDVVYPSAAAATESGLYHLLPWDGVVRVPSAIPSSRVSSPPLLPRFAYSGNLLLGFGALPTPEALTLLFRMEPLPDTGDAPMPPVAWEILSSKGWIPLGQKGIVNDGTRGLTQTGILTLALPRVETPSDPRMPGPYTWVRGAVGPSETSPLRASPPPVAVPVPVEERFPRTVDLYPNAVLATWQKQEGSGQHLTSPLPPHSITQALVDLPDVEAIDQPMASFGGRPAEDDRAFFIRLGERLRHKDRAILSWDHERIVFEDFPVIEQVVALPTRSPGGGGRPGHVLIVALPGPGGGESLDPTAPACTSDLLVQIEERLRRAASPFVKIRAVSPTYVRIGVTASIEFREDYDPGESTKRLDADLVAYLSPWTDSPEKAARGADYASEDAILDFIATRPYVAAIASLSFEYTPPLAASGTASPERRPREGLEQYYLTSAKGHHITDATADTSGRPLGY